MLKPQNDEETIKNNYPAIESLLREFPDVFPDEIPKRLPPNISKNFDIELTTKATPQNSGLYCM